GITDEDRGNLLPDATADARARRRLHQPSGALAAELSVHAGAVTACDFGLQRGARKSAARQPATPEANHGRCAADLARPPGNRNLCGIYRSHGESRTRTRGSGPDGESIYDHRAAVLHEGKLSVPVLIAAQATMCTNVPGFLR